MAERVVVIGRNYTSRLGMIRAAGMAGYDVTVIRTVNAANREAFDEKSKYVKAYFLYRKRILHR